MACPYHAEIRTDEKPYDTEREEEKIIHFSKTGKWGGTDMFSEFDF